ncbi:1-deoxy-D-xylulose-5-phosphate reductoisomerase [Actinotalea sp. M2MS4P-6]|uniref:1-deoxy-D-xylulose-5-phosphate reductoisomerase n=1 Tax=Actinotalea sp. M2MS4P-6 TaxID=2983762 RepID=UPI0021E38BB1|nr:1-deoxy-D-xylulose-5-phosphate reductoisomerase [Actinotalea sp. M2MS4P-6]MCV2396108.1 1-deoxy-D-xylulose-5-phosphate reductoisomerase [Actinotalea sp. M2MS4P-6]
MAPRSVILLGSTGSIGTQALDVVAQHPDRFDVVGLAAGGADPDLVARQVLATGARVVAVADQTAGPAVRAAIEVRAAAAGRRAPDLELLSGPDAASRLAARGADVVLNGITGSVGLGPTLAALRAGSTLALANKESLVVGGRLVRQAQVRPDQIVPVDSEHSAIAQCLRSGSAAEVRRIVLTASGGPFRGASRTDLAGVTSEQALAHPTWSMGPVVTVNSASMVNKGLELIEAHLLFDVPVADITVVVHPQSIVHSMVEFTDGSTIAQASPPDMRLPIALGLSWPDRLDPVTPPCDWTRAASWTFEPLDEEVFAAVRLARRSVAASATHPAVYNAANEQGVAAFLAGRIGFLDIVDTVAQVLDEHDGTAASDVSLQAVLDAERWARGRADTLLARR